MVDSSDVLGELAYNDEDDEPAPTLDDCRQTELARAVMVIEADMLEATSEGLCVRVQCSAGVDAKGPCCSRWDG